MAERKDLNYIVTVLIIVAVVVTIGMVFYARIDRSYAFTDKESSVTAVEDGWMRRTKSGGLTEFTAFGTDSGFKEVTISRVFAFPENLNLNTLRFLASYCAVEVWQDGVLKYSLWTDEDVESGRFLGIQEVCVGLDSTPGGVSYVVLRLRSSSSITVSTIYLGTASDIVVDSFSNALPTIVFVTASLVLAVSMLIIVFVGRRRYYIPQYYYYFMLFVFACAFYLLANVKTSSAFKADPVDSSVALYEWLMLMPVPFCLFLYHTFKRLRKADLILAGAEVLEMIVMNLLHLSGAKSLAQMLIFPVAAIGLSLGLALVQAVVDFIFDRNRASVAIFVGLVFLASGVLIQMMEYYGSRKSSFSIFFLAGIFLFNLVQIISIINSIFRLLEEGKKAGDYLIMAKTDSLTGLGNRRALDLYIQELCKKNQQQFRLGCIVCDLNDLKKTNDVYGHAVGDRLIKDFAKCLETCFENRGIPFRTGGDEFYILFSDVEVDMKAMMHRLLIGLEGSNSNSEYRISCSSGCHADYVPAHDESAVWEIIKTADAEMYKQKRKDREFRESRKNKDKKEELPD